MKYFKAKHSEFYLAKTDKYNINVYICGIGCSIGIREIDDNEFYNEKHKSEECTREEFEKAYLGAYSQIHTKFLSSKEQSRDEFIKNMQIKMDEHEF